MYLEAIKNRLKSNQIYLSEEKIIDKATVIGYEKKFKWIWLATQMNTFIVTSDFGDQEITIDLIEKHFDEAFKYAKNNYTGWPQGLQSGICVISILISSKISVEAKDYCIGLKSGKKWAGSSIPIIIDSDTNAIYQFKHNPMWGKIYYPHFKKLIKKLI